jgi:hypothetical protein
MSDEKVDEPVTCPQCHGEGKVVVSEESKRRFLQGLWQWEALKGKSNVELAGMVSEIENYLRHRDLSPVIHQWLGEVWWRLQAADEPIEETRRKIDGLTEDPAWLEKP